MLWAQVKIKLKKLLPKRHGMRSKPPIPGRYLKIMAEFVEGFEKMASIGPCVSIFGSARTKQDHKYYILAEEIAYKLTQNRVMALLREADPVLWKLPIKEQRRGDGISVGLNIHLPFEQSSNPYIDHDKLITFKHFFVRKVMFQKYAQGFIVLPGGFGTFDEFFESATLIQTGKIGKFPIVLVGRISGKDLWIG